MLLERDPGRQEIGESGENSGDVIYLYIFLNNIFFNGLTRMPVVARVWREITSSLPPPLRPPSPLHRHLPLSPPEKNNKCGTESRRATDEDLWEWVPMATDDLGFPIKAEACHFWSRDRNVKRHDAV